MVEAYNELSTTRSIGMAIGPIPVTAIWEWCDRHGLDDDLRAHVSVIIRIVDAETLKRAHSKNHGR